MSRSKNRSKRKEDKSKTSRSTTNALRFLYELAIKLHQDHTDISYPFWLPVDPELMDAPDYFDVVQHPMDLSTIMGKIHSGLYQSAMDCLKDFDLMLNNCFKYNRPGTPTNSLGQATQAKIKDLLQDIPKVEITEPLRLKKFDIESDLEGVDFGFSGDEMEEVKGENVGHLAEDEKPIKEEYIEEPMHLDDVKKEDICSVKEENVKAPMNLNIEDVKKEDICSIKEENVEAPMNPNIEDVKKEDIYCIKEETVEAPMNVNFADVKKEEMYSTQKENVEEPITLNSGSKHESSSFVDPVEFEMRDLIESMTLGKNNFQEETKITDFNNEPLEDIEMKFNDEVLTEIQKIESIVKYLKEVEQENEHFEEDFNVDDILLQDAEEIESIVKYLKEVEQENEHFEEDFNIDDILLQDVEEIIDSSFDSSRIESDIDILQTEFGGLNIALDDSYIERYLDFPLEGGTFEEYFNNTEKEFQDLTMEMPASGGKETNYIQTDTTIDEVSKDHDRGWGVNPEKEISHTDIIVAFGEEMDDAEMDIKPANEEIQDKTENFAESKDTCNTIVPEETNYFNKEQRKYLVIEEHRAETILNEEKEEYNLGKDENLVKDTFHAKTIVSLAEEANDIEKEEHHAEKELNPVKEEENVVDQYANSAIERRCIELETNAAKEQNDIQTKLCTANSNSNTENLSNKDFKLSNSNCKIPHIGIEIDQISTVEDIKIESVKSLRRKRRKEISEEECFPKAKHLKPNSTLLDSKQDKKLKKRRPKLNPNSSEKIEKKIEGFDSELGIPNIGFENNLIIPEKDNKIENVKPRKNDIGIENNSISPEEDIKIERDKSLKRKQIDAQSNSDESRPDAKRLKSNSSLTVPNCEQTSKRGRPRLNQNPVIKKKESKVKQIPTYSSMSKSKHYKHVTQSEKEEIYRQAIPAGSKLGADIKMEDIVLVVLCVRDMPDHLVAPLLHLIKIYQQNVLNGNGKNGIRFHLMGRTLLKKIKKYFRLNKLL